MSFSTYRSSRRLCVLMGALAAVAAVAPPAAVARQRADVGVVSLAGTNHLRFSRSGVLDVSLPEPTSLHFPLRGRSRHIVVQGDGRFVGMVLAAWDGRFHLRGAPLVIAGTYRRCGTPGCSGRAYPFNQPTGLERWDRIRLPAGRYRLYVVTDGALGQLTLTLPGLTGSVELPAPRAATASVREPEVQVSGGPDATVYSAGQTDSVEWSTLSWTVLWLSGQPGPWAEMGTCRYEGRPPVPEKVAYLPTCEDTGASGYQHGWVAPGATGFEATMSWLDALPQGTTSHGGYAMSASAAGTSGALNVLIDY